jgi:hypothetical protein
MQLPVFIMPVITLSPGRGGLPPMQRPATSEGGSNIGWMVEYN